MSYSTVGMHIQITLGKEAKTNKNNAKSNATINLKLTFSFYREPMIYLSQYS